MKRHGMTIVLLLNQKTVTTKIKFRQYSSKGERRTENEANYRTRYQYGDRDVPTHFMDEAEKPT